LSIASCSDSEQPISVPSLSNISEITVLDISNNRNASDIEVNFKKQEDTQQILEYRVFLIKSNLSNDFSINDAESSSTYSRAQPEDIFPVEGLMLATGATDTEGDLISDQESYIIGVLSVSTNQEIASNAFLKTTTPFQLKNNNLIKNHTQQLQLGMGSLSMDNEGNIYMGTHDIIESDLFGGTEKLFPVIKISESGAPQEYTQPFTGLGGNDFDASGNLYQTILRTGRILKISDQGVVTELIKEEDDRGFKLESVDGIYVDHDQNVFVVDVATNSVVIITPEGLSSQFAQIPPYARGITGDENGNLYISHNTEEGLITKVDATGNVSRFAMVPALFPLNYQLEFLQWIGYIKYRDQELYITSPSTNKIFKIDMAGSVSLFAGSGFRFKPRGGALTANLNRPYGLVFNNEENTLFISGSADLEPRHTQSSMPSAIWKIELVE